MAPVYKRNRNSLFETELPGSTQKLGSLLKSDPKRTNKAIHSLDIAVKGLGPNRQGKGHAQKLVTEFDKILENELSQSTDVQDRDLSLLPLIGIEPVKKRNTKLQVAAAEKEEGRETELGHDGRFDDPLTEYSSPTASASRAPSRTRLKKDTPGPHISAFSSNSKNDLLSDHEASMPSDFDDSDQSFYSCPGTPSRSGSAGRKIEPGNAYSLLPPSNREAMRTTQKPRRVAYHPSDLEFARGISSLHLSVFTNSGKRPLISMPSLKPGARTHRKFHSAKQRNGFEKKAQESFGTDATYSAESSFNASSSFSNKAEKGWSPPTSADTSFNDTKDAGSMNRPDKLKGAEIAQLAVVAEAIDGTEISGEVEAPYNGDLDEEITDIDDTEINCGNKQSRALAQRPKKALSNARPIPPSKEQPLQRNSKKRTSGTPKSNGRKGQAEKQAAEKGDGDREKGEEEEEKGEEEDEEVFQMLAKAFFGGEAESDSGSQLPHGDMPADEDGTFHVGQQAIYLNEDDGVQTDAALVEDEGESPIDNLISKLELTEEACELSDDEDEFGTIDALFENEFSENPALKSTAHPLPTLPFSIQHEATRVALNKGLRSNDVICAHLHGYCDDLYKATEYRDVWETLTRFSKAAATLEWTGESVWRGFRDGRGWSDNVFITGRVHYGENQQAQSSPTKGTQFSTQEKVSEKPPLIITLNPLTRTSGNRFFNRFGSDRFLTLRLPPLSSQSGLPKELVQQCRGRIIDWLADEEICLMNRTWKCFFVKDGSSKRKSGEDKSVITEYFSQAIFFATEGVGIGDNLSSEEMEALGFRPSEKKMRQKMTVEDLLRWHIPLDGNLNMTVPKFWSRISLGLSNATPTITFEPSQIRPVSDIKSTTGEVMNDGCSITSPAVMKIVRQKLGLEVTPTAVQARLGGAKGVWMVDPRADWDSEDIYIEVTESQSKYKGYENDDDWARLTLDVLTASHDPLPAKVNIQLIPILEDRGVPFEALQELLEEHLERDLDELFRILDKPVELRRWIYDRGRIGNERMMAKCVTTLSALPANRHEIAIMLLESGFLVSECKFLMEQVRKFIDQHCDELKTKLHIEIPHSTTLLCVADPTGTLEEGEVSLRFSKGVLDPKTMRRNQVITGDILVARNPAQLPSDIQKVKAVDIQPHHFHGLRELQDVIVFSAKGDRSLASLLSGGDYDGDKPWVCWDQRLVEPFQNSPTAFDEFEKQAQLHFEKSEIRMVDLSPDQPGFFNRFFRAGISNSLQDNFLGHCTSVWEKYCYSKNRISDPTAIGLAKLCSFLVDAPKQGLSILPSKRDEITTLGYRYPKPAYREPGSRGQGVHIIDRLQFDIAEQKVMEKQKAFHDSFGDGQSYEPLITAIYHREKGYIGKEGPGEPVALVLKHLNQELQNLLDDWRNWTNGPKGGADEFKSGVPGFYRRFREIMPPEEFSKDPVISRWVSEVGSHFSHWNILRASAAYYKWKGQSSLVWYMAGRELCFIKSHAMQMTKSDFGPRSVIEEMYIPLKTSGKFRGGKKVIVADAQDNA